MYIGRFSCHLVTAKAGLQRVLTGYILVALWSVVHGYSIQSSKGHYRSSCSHVLQVLIGMWQQIIWILSFKFYGDMRVWVQRIYSMQAVNIFRLAARWLNLSQIQTTINALQIITVVVVHYFCKFFAKEWLDNNDSAGVQGDQLCRTDPNMYVLTPFGQDGKNEIKMGKCCPSYCFVFNMQY